MATLSCGQHKVLNRAVTALITSTAPGLVSAAGLSPAAAAAGLAAASTRALSAVTAGPAFKLPDMPYDYGALEPFLSGEIMRLHHTKHHAAYVNNLNAALDKYAAASAKGAVADMIALQGAIRFNGGGHVNHAIFWENLAPAGKGGGGEPAGELAAAIAERFGSFAAFKAAMTAGGVSVQVRRRGEKGEGGRGCTQRGVAARGARRPLGGPERRPAERTRGGAGKGEGGADAGR
jgi:hypothetical protein